MKKYFPLLMIALIIFALNVSEENQISKKLLISAVMVEPAEGENYNFTFAVLENQQEEVKTSYKTVRTKTFAQAVEYMEKTQGRQAVISTCRCLILSDNLSVSEEQNFINAFADNCSAVPKLSVIGCTEKAARLVLKNQPDIQRILSLSEKPQTLPAAVNFGQIQNKLAASGEDLILEKII